VILDLFIPEKWEDELDLGIDYIPKWFTRLQTVTHPGITT